MDSNDFSMDMLSLKQSSSDFLLNSEDIYSGDSPAPGGLSHTVRSYNSVPQQILSHGLLSISEVEFIESALGKLYVDVCGPQVEKMRNLLREKVWFAFDLDDTLHEYSERHPVQLRLQSSSTSTSPTTSPSMIFHLHTPLFSHRRHPVPSLTAEPLPSSEKSAFLSALLESHTLASDDEVLLNHLAGLYKNTLEKSLQLKPGALRLLQHLRVLSKKIMIITEGPLDAQQWTMTTLGIAPYVDILVTTNDMGKSKIDGLFGTVLQKFGITPDDMIYIGDNAVRDVAPARAEGIWSWLYDEKNHCKFDVEAPRINSLLKMKHILG